MQGQKLIVIRGPSGSGKSTVAKAVRLKFLEKRRQVAYVEQDYFRRIILKEKDVPGGFNSEFIRQTVKFFLENRYDVVLEGIFDKSRYEAMFESLLRLHPSNNFFFYLDVSLIETLKRHTTKPSRDDYGENEMRAWYKEEDFLACVREEVISETSSFSETVNFICLSSGG